jgi:hypothetical protein
LRGVHDDITINYGKKLSRRCFRLLQRLYPASAAAISPVLLPPFRARSGRVGMNSGCQNDASTASYSARDSINEGCNLRELLFMFSVSAVIKLTDAI